MNSNIFFQPFVGKDYANGGIFGKRIMILGESHYCDEECVDCGDCCLHRECMGFTQQVLDDYLNENKERQNWMRTFLKFERSLVGEETDQTMRLKIWNSVVFFNYLQVAMGGPREAGVMAVNHPSVGYLTRISLYAKYHSVSKTWMLKELHYPCLTFRKSKM